MYFLYSNTLPESFTLLSNQEGKDQFSTGWGQSTISATIYGFFCVYNFKTYFFFVF